MNEITHPNRASDVPWPTHPQVREPDAPALPDGAQGAAAGVGLLGHAVQGAHDTLDRLADGAAPAARQIGERVAAAGEALHATTDRLRHTRDEWVEGARSTVRGHPLAWLAAAVALGAVIARIGRSSR